MTSEVMVEFEAAGSGAIVQSVCLETNDRANPLVCLLLHGQVRDDVVVRPTRLRIVCERGGSPRRLLRITGPQGMDLGRVSCEASTLSVDVQPLALAGGDSTAWELSLLVAKDLPVGRTTDRVHIEVTRGDQPAIIVPVTIEVRPRLAVTPPRAFFGLVTAGTRRTLTLTARCRGGEAFRLTPAGTQQEGLAVQLVQRSPEEWRIEIVLLPDKPGIIERDVTITTDVQGEEQLRVPVYAEVTAAP